MNSGLVVGKNMEQPSTNWCRSWPVTPVDWGPGGWQTNPRGLGDFLRHSERFINQLRAINTHINL